MQLPAPPRRSPRENIVPMINIVFLLLVFFLLTATIAPPDPVVLDLPEAVAEPAPDAALDTAHLTADGVLVYGQAQGPDALAALAARADPAAPVLLRADAALDGADFAAHLARLAAAGVGAVTLVVNQP